MRPSDDSKSHSVVIYPGSVAPECSGKDNHELLAVSNGGQLGSREGLRDEQGLSRSNLCNGRTIADRGQSGDPELRKANVPAVVLESQVSEGVAGSDTE